MNFDSYMPYKLITGRGCVKDNYSLLSAQGSKCLIVTSGSAAKRSGALDDMLEALAKAQVEHIIYDKVKANPILLDSKEAGDIARDFGAQFVVGIGGGSALDASKAAAVFAANDIPAMDIYNLDWKTPALPLVLVGTTSGTGSEVAPYAVMTTPDGRKRSFAGDDIFATIAFGDATYTDTLPLNFTISTALDALSHALEGYFATSANALTDLHAIEAVRYLYPMLTALKGIKSVDEITSDMRDKLYYASVLAGFTLAKTGTCYCHSLGYFLSEEHDVPHGTACAATLSDFLRRGNRLVPDKAAILFERAGCTVDELSTLIEDLTHIPDIKLSSEEITDIVDRNCTNKNFIRTAPNGYTREEALTLMTELFGK